jgi:hypothetical protein
MSKKALSPVPSGKPFREIVPGGDITVFSDRWKWIEKDMVPAFERLSLSSLRWLVNPPLEQLAEGRRLAPIK